MFSASPSPSPISCLERDFLTWEQNVEKAKKEIARLEAEEAASGNGKANGEAKEEKPEEAKEETKEEAVAAE